MSLLVFLCSFVPFVGAIVSGTLVCIVALLVKDLFWALVMLGIVIVVQQLESHVLQPFIMGTAVRVHPLGVVVAVAVGTLVAGIPGALFAVPLVAVANTMIGYLVRREWMPESARAGRDGDPAGVKLQP
jgi:predicted PurR-regulated permease PerM